MPIGYLAKLVGWDVYMKLPKSDATPPDNCTAIAMKLFKIAHSQ
jgi:hypothetical protein